MLQFLPKVNRLITGETTFAIYVETNLFLIAFWYNTKWLTLERNFLCVHFVIRNLHSLVHYQDTREKNHQCLDCGKWFQEESFKTSPTYIQWRETTCMQFMWLNFFTVSQSESSHEEPCKLCQTPFLGLANLQTHEKIHTGEMHYNCLQCNSSFESRHEQIYHNRSEHKMLKCQTQRCNLRFQSYPLSQSTSKLIDPLQKDFQISEPLQLPCLCSW